MSDDTLIKVEGVSKKFCRSLGRSIQYGLQDVARDLVDLSSKPGELRKTEFWAVDDVSFELKKGEALGIIGPNGSGKTTILKMLNGIFMPDKGRIDIKGRVGALIEVGAGFHPMLTGRENIYINAAILGMCKKEIDKKFDSIVDFADIGDFIDAPVKFYSSGMYVRLGFAIAIHCEPDILLVDEVLAVGDSAFRSKCYQRMNEIKKETDVAIVFVSHSLLTVERFCDKGIFLHNGIIKSQGKIHTAIQDYQKIINQLLEKQKAVSGVIPGMPYCTKEVEITNVKYLNRDNKEQKEFLPGDALGIRVEYKANRIISNPVFQISLLNREGVHISVFGTHLENIQIESISGNGTVECWIDSLPLLLNNYYASVTIYDKTPNITFDYWNGAISNKYFQVLPNQVSTKMHEWTPVCHFKSKWKINGKDVHPG